MNFVSFSIPAKVKFLITNAFFLCIFQPALPQTEQPSESIQTQTFIFTGSSQKFLVPEGVTSLQVELAGASGGKSCRKNYQYGQPGLGGKVSATLHVAPGQQLSIFAGGAGGNGTSAKQGIGGYNGGAKGATVTNEYASGGGGGSSDIRLSDQTLENRLVVAGGGGASGKFGAGGNGGGLSGADGYGEGENATGGNQKHGGLSGSYFGSYFAQNGAFGKGGASSAGATGGGGGGGWYGGGGGSFGDGAGGSSYAANVANNVVHIQGANEGNGWVKITWRKSITATPPVNETPVSKSNLKIYPNPAVGDFYMQLKNEAAGKAEITLRLANGAIFLKQSFWLKNSNALLKYSIPGKVPGVYFINVVTATSKQAGSVVVD